MKKAFILCILAICGTLRAQTITVGPVSKTLLCVGDSITVPYQATGPFAADNKFFVQLSDKNGSFTSFNSIGSNASTHGSFSIVLSSVGANFHLKVASTDPYILSDSNTTDIQVISLPMPNPIVSPAWPFVDNTIHVLDNEPAGSQFSWTFNDSDASIHTSQDSFPTLTYSHEGLKSGSVSVTNTSGCSETEAFTFNVLNCHPTIPSNAHIVTGSEIDHGFPFVWVKAGGSYKPDYSIDHQEVIFMEPGSYAWLIGSGDYVNIFYIRSGASMNALSGEYASVTVQESGNVNLPSSYNVYCPDLTFDYSQIPSSVAEGLAPTTTIRQSGNYLIVNSEVGYENVHIMNILGDEVLSRNGSGSLDIDLSQLPAGVYFAVVQAGDVREVKKIAVVH